MEASSQPQQFCWDERQYLSRNSSRREPSLPLFPDQHSRKTRSWSSSGSPGGPISGCEAREPCIHTKLLPEQQRCVDNGSGGDIAEGLAALPCLLVTTQSKSCSALAKKAETLYLNLTDLIERRGIERIAFYTLTFAENLKSRRVAGNRFNSYASNYLRAKVDEYIATVERQKRGAIHYHLVVAFPFDVRSGFDFAAAREASAAHKRDDREGQRAAMVRVTRSANNNLRNWWIESREAAKRFGFGRCETLPVLSNSAAVSRYVGGYVGSEWDNRKPADRGLRTIRYGLKQRAASVRWSWAFGGGPIWRKGCAVLSAILSTDDFTGVLGKRWAHYWAKEILAFGRHFEKCLVFIERTLSDCDDFTARVGFAAQMCDAIIAKEEELNAGERNSSKPDVCVDALPSSASG